MEAKVYALAPEPTARGALLNFTFELTFPDGDLIPLAATGYLYAPHNVLVCPLTQATVDQDGEIGLRGTDGYGRPKDPKTYHLSMLAALGELELDHIADLRTKDPKGDVYLTVKLGVRCLVTCSTVTHVEKVGPSPQDHSAFGAVIRERPVPSSQRLVGEGREGFLKATTFVKQIPHRIPGNDWTHDFAPRFGLGKFLVFELPQPTIVGAGPVQERAEIALREARKAEQHLVAGNWTAACSSLRAAWELLRNSADIRALLMRDGYTGSAAEAFDQATQQLFQFASKFMHVVDKQGNVISGPEIRANKEEALASMATAMAFINLVAQKAR